jgi:hypothetical protein
LISGFDIEFTAAGQARVRSNWMVFAGEGPLPIDGTMPFLVTDVTDDLYQNGDEWLIAARTITPVFRNLSSPGPAQSATRSITLFP